MLLGDWLASFGVTVVGMESTGVSWRPGYYLLEDDVQCWLLNAAHLGTVPGRKTDVADSVGSCQLVEHGLVRPLFVPPKPIRELRELTRYRKALIGERTVRPSGCRRSWRTPGPELGTVASDVLGASGRAMGDALVSGTHDPVVLAELAKGRLRAKLPALREALAGRFRAIMGCWWASCWPSWATSTRHRAAQHPGRPGGRPPRAAAGPVDHHPGGQPADR